jgi:murein DD-endopeptidase MepM/ murein hydrolase activator NlpD
VTRRFVSPVKLHTFLSCWLCAGFAGAALLPGFAQSFQLPTANRALFDPDGGAERFFVPTVGKPWTSGCFGCVRSEGWQLHEGIDIRCLARDKRGEATDPVLATAAGKVVYANRKASLSNYGIYLILQHRVDEIEVYSTYAHLKEIRADLRAGATVAAGETIGIMGRTANTREGISRERAHVHFELNLFLNDHFPAWFKKNHPGQRNDHAQWNGQNLLGLDPSAVLRAAKELGPKFNLRDFLQSQPELCRVILRDTDFPWLRRYAALIQPNPRAAKEGVAAHELVLNYVGIPIAVIPRAASELTSKSRFHLLSVNAAEAKANPCRKLVTERNGRWELAPNGQKLLELLTF